jgi:hypothetical protein
MTTEITCNTRTTPTRSTINVPISPELKARFYGYCRSHGLAPVKVIRLNILQLLDEAQEQPAPWSVKIGGAK